MISTVITPDTAASNVTVEPFKPASVVKRLRAATVKVKADKKKKKAKAKEISAMALDIATAAGICGVITKTFGSEERPSHVVKLPAWSEFKATLPEGTEGTALAQMFLALRSAVEVLCGDAASTWVIHTSGSFALYGKFSA